jgi:dCMP deaminase
LQLGACVVNADNCIIGQGYNGMPHGCSDDVFPWAIDNPDPLHNKYLYGTIDQISFLMDCEALPLIT